MYVLLNIVTRLAEKFHKVSNKMFVVSVTSCKNELQTAPLIDAFANETL